MSGGVRPNSKLKQEKNNAYIDLAQFKLDQRRSHRHSRCAPCHRSGRQRGPAQTPQQERSGGADHDRQVARRPLETRSILQGGGGQTRSRSEGSRRTGGGIPQEFDLAGVGGEGSDEARHACPLRVLRQIGSRSGQRRARDGSGARAKGKGRRPEPQMKRLRGRSNSAEWSSKKGTLDVPFLLDAAWAGQPSW